MTNQLTLTSQATGQVVAYIEQPETDAEAISSWIAGKASGLTRQAYKANIDSFLSSIAGKPLAAVRQSDVHTWLASMTEAAPATIEQRLATIKSLVRYLLAVGVITRNFTVGIKLAKVENKLAEKIIDRDDIVRMVDRAKSPRDQAIIWIAYQGGLRVDELCGLEWRHLNGAVLTVTGKGSKTRFITLGDKALARLVALRTADSLPTSPMFVSRKGKGHLDPVQVWRIVKDAAGSVAGGVSTHWLRHSCASHLLDHGVTVKAVQEVLGHANIATTSGYLHIKTGAVSTAALD